MLLRCTGIRSWRSHLIVSTLPSSFWNSSSLMPKSEQVEADAADALLRLQVDRHEGHCQAHDRAHDQRSQHAQPQISCNQGNIESRKGAEQHLPFNAQVQNAAALAEGFADGGIQVRCRQPDSRGENSDQDRGR